MKNKKYKLVKGVICAALAGVMVTSFSGCSNVKNIVDENQENPVSLYDEAGNPLSVIAFVDEDNITDFKDEELYGYIQKDGEKIKFYDVEYNNTYTLYEGLLSNYSVYYTYFTNLLVEEDFNKALGYGSIDKSVINLMQNNLSVYRAINEEYMICNKGVFNINQDNSSTLEKLNPETYFVDSAQNNKEQETALAKNMN